MDAQKIENMSKNLMRQVDKLIDSTNRGSYETRRTYRASYKPFADFLAEKFHLQKIENVKEKHFVAYAQHRSESTAGSTITKDLSGIRFVHELSESRFPLPTNADLNKQEIEFKDKDSGKVDRAWTDREIDRAKMVAAGIDRQDIVVSIDMARTFGLRINETASLRISQVKTALNDGYLHIKGKGGKERDIPVRNGAQAQALESALRYAKSQERSWLGEYVLASSAKRGVQAEKTSIQNWVSNHREKFQDDRSEKNNSETRQDSLESNKKIENVTLHGLRHSFARELYSEALEKHIESRENQSDAEYHARLEVSHQLGHGRDSVTRIYLT